MAWLAGPGWCTRPKSTSSGRVLHVRPCDHRRCDARSLGVLLEGPPLVFRQLIDRRRRSTRRIRPLQGDAAGLGGDASRLEGDAARLEGKRRHSGVHAVHPKRTAVGSAKGGRGFGRDSLQAVASAKDGCPSPTAAGVRPAERALLIGPGRRAVTSRPRRRVCWNRPTGRTGYRSDRRRVDVTPPAQQRDPPGGQSRADRRRMHRTAPDHQPLPRQDHGPRWTRPCRSV